MMIQARGTGESAGNGSAIVVWHGSRLAFGAEGSSEVVEAAARALEIEDRDDISIINEIEIDASAFKVVPAHLTVWVEAGGERL